MKLQTHAVITSYFEASNANDIAALVVCFSTDASVSDENQTHRGTAEIKAWAEDNRRKFQFKTEPLRASARADGAVVTAKLSGNFPGSPVDLDFTFNLENNKIKSLDIG
jgi:ketosteroid isomerase-like protein